MTSKRISDLITKKILIGLSEEEEKELNEWLEKSSKNKELYSSICNMRNYEDYISKIKKFDITKNHQLVKLRFKQKLQSKRLLLFTKYAAIFILLFCVWKVLDYTFSIKQTEQITRKVEIVKPGSKKAKLIFADGKQIILTDKLSEKVISNDNISICSDSTTIRYKSNDKATPEINKITVPKGGEYNFFLPDGTHVFLNSESSIEFPVAFLGNKRDVRITGEVYFAVYKNKQKPFIVHSDIVDVQVTGTKFNIKAYPDEYKIQTTLVEGGVDIYYGKGKKRKVSITPNQQAEVLRSENNISIREVDTDIYTSWLNNQFIFEDQTLEEIMTVLSRWYDINLFYQNEKVKEIKFTGRFYRYGDIKQILDMISYTDKVKINYNKNTIIIKEK